MRGGFLSAINRLFDQRAIRKPMGFRRWVRQAIFLFYSPKEDVSQLNGITFPIMFVPYELCIEIFHTIP